MNLKALLMPYDLYERHAVVSQLLTTAIGPGRSATSVLDVGGRTELLTRFLPYQVTSINPDGTGNLVASGRAIPYANDSFDAVVNIDTLEHLPPDRRILFLQECLRVARRFIVIAAPYGSEAHIAFEKELNNRYLAAFGQPHAYLSEHVQYGLPRQGELDGYETQLPTSTIEWYFAGDYVWQGASFARAIVAHNQQRLIRALLHLYNQITSMALFHPIRLRRQPTETTNRFYLLAEKQ